MVDMTLLEDWGMATTVSAAKAKAESAERIRKAEADRLVTHAATKLSEDSFRQVWDNPDAECDRL